MEEVIIIGAGPCGISAAIECKKQGIEPLIIEKGCIGNSIYHYPTGMTFFSSPENIEIGDLPFTTIQDKPTRLEALKYYQKVAKWYQLKIHTYEKVIDLKKVPVGFLVDTETREGRKTYEAKQVIIATGYYDNPNLMGVPGEELPHVFHYFKDGYPYAGHPVVVIGGRNSAVDAALELQLAGADVTMVYRRDAFSDSVKSWVKPVIEAAIEKKRIKMIWNAEVVEIKNRSVIVDVHGEQKEIPADFVFAMTGYRPDLSLLQKVGVEMDAETHVPVCSDEMETNVSGLYLAGVVVTGNDSGKIFIENGRFHGRTIAQAIRQKQEQN